MNDYDFRDEEPLWVRYAEFIDHRSNKFYECRVDLADDGAFVITRRWGARPDTGAGQIKTETRQNATQATGVASTYYYAKIHKGYVEIPRPHAANSKVLKEYATDDLDDEDY